VYRRLNAGGGTAGSIRASARSQLADALDREGRLGERPDRQLQQDERVVVARAAIQVELVTTATPMNEDPLSVPANGDGDRFHERAALRVAIARTVVVQVAAPQAVRAVIAVSGADGAGRNVQAAMAATEREPSVAPLTAALIT
jgi:hypothetical protein